MAVIRALTSSDANHITALANISDCASAMDLVLTNALEAGAKSIAIHCPSPFNSFTVSDDGTGFTLSSLIKIGKAPHTFKSDRSSGGKGLFFLSQVATVKICSHSPVSHRRKVKTLTFGSYDEVTDVLVGGDTRSAFNTVIEVSDLFQNSPVRAHHLKSNSALQQASISKLLLEKAAIYPEVTFSWNIDGSNMRFKAVETSFMRLPLLFLAFDLPAHWLHLGGSVAGFSYYGHVISPTSIDLAQRPSTRLLFFNHKQVRSLELFSMLDALWSRAIPYYHSEEKVIKKVPAFFLAIEGGKEDCEVIRSLDSSSSMLRFLPTSPFLSFLRQDLTRLLKIASKSEAANAQDGEVITLEANSPSPTATTQESDDSYENQGHSGTIVDFKDAWKSRSETRLFSRCAQFLMLPPSLGYELSAPSLAHLLVIGQSENKFILALDPDSRTLLAFDQHAVHERIRFEHLLRLCNRNPASIVSSQALEKPLRLELAAADMIKLRKIDSFVKLWGWRLTLPSSNFPDQTAVMVGLHVLVQETPRIGNRIVEPARLLEHLSGSDLTASSTSVPSYVLEIIKSKACRGAIMFGDKLTLETMSRLLKELSNCANPFACAHGRTNVAILGRI